MNDRFALDPYLAEQRRRVESWLEARLVAQESGAPARLLEAMRYPLAAGGKRLRPILCLAFAEALASPPPGEVEDAACALEWVHTYSLVHDDLPSMDDDDLRRGRPTTHRVYGEAMGILVGDALLTAAFGVLAHGAPNPRRQALCAELAQAAGAVGMVGGQVLDVAEDRPARLDYLEDLHRRKTGALIRAACRMGVLAGGGSADALAVADRYGDAVGLAFQIADDVLDATASAEALGKPAGADARAGRPTFPAVVGLEGARARARQCVEAAEAAVAPWGPRAEPLRALARYALERQT